MKTIAAWQFLSLWILPTAAIFAQTVSISPQDVIIRLVANASRNPLGPVENDTTDQTIRTAKAMQKDSTFGNGAGSFRQYIAAEYNGYAVEGPLISLCSEGTAALFYSKVKLTADAVADHKNDGGVPGFGEAGGFLIWVGPKIRDDGHVIATFCLVQQHGSWKVHGVYLSNKIIADSNKTFIVSQLAAFAKKQ